MKDLVQSLKAEHVNIVRILTKVRELGIETDEGRRALMAAKNGLLAHLKREDEDLYPALLKAAEDDPILRDALDFFHDDIEGVAKAALKFFEKYEAGDGGADFAADFAADFDRVADVLIQRIQKEESVIYKMFNQL